DSVPSDLATYELYRGVTDADAGEMTDTEEVGDSAAVWVKLNMYDGVGGIGRLRGFDVDEACEVARLLDADGHLDAIEPTAGSSLLNPMYLFHGDAPRDAFADAFHGAMHWGLKAAGPFFLKHYDYRPGYLMPLARRLRESVDLPIILLGGITDRQTMEAALDEGFDFLAMGRALLREPDLPLRIADDPAVRSQCTHCNLCMPTIYSHTHCPLREPAGA
ncbi:hypothetical protein ACWDNR_21425, partial [Gordonia aichiensis]